MRTSATSSERGRAPPRPQTRRARTTRAERASPCARTLRAYLTGARGCAGFCKGRPGNQWAKPKGGSVGLGVGIFLIAVGAILTFAVNATSSSVNVDAVGWILMAVGLASILLSLLFWQSWAGPGYLSRRRTYVDEGPPPEARY